MLGAQLALQAIDAALDAFGGKGIDEDYGLINGIAKGVLGLPRSH